MFKEMKYKPSIEFQILAHGVHKVAEFWVISRGTHPCIYIDATDFPQDAFDRAPIHGGITYDEDRLQNVWDEAFEGFQPKQRRFIGWDYAHCNDYIEYPSGIPSGEMNTRKWTTKEMVEDAKEVIDHGIDYTNGEEGNK